MNRAAAAPATRHWVPYAIGAALLIAATIVAYLPAFDAGWFIMDHGVFVTDNPLIHAADGLRRFWFTREATDYWPVTSSTLWLEWRVWGMNAAGNHVTNLVLHLTNAFLLWGLLRRLKVPGAYLGVLLFALHPLNVESVAWITERKNLVAMLFFLLSIWAFLAAEDGDDARRIRRWSTASLIAFALAMLSKGSVVFLPLVLLGIVAWRRRPTRADLGRLLAAGALTAVLWHFRRTWSRPGLFAWGYFCAALLRAQGPK